MIHNTHTRNLFPIPILCTLAPTRPRDALQHAADCPAANPSAPRRPGTGSAVLGGRYDGPSWACFHSPAARSTLMAGIPGAAVAESVRTEKLSGLITTEKVTSP